MSLAEVEVFDPRMSGLMLHNVHLEQLYTGCRWAEGPVYFPLGDYLLWSDIPNNRTMQWVPDLGARVFSHASNNSNGNTRDREGRRVTCEHLTRSVVRTELDGSRTVLASEHQGKRLNSPNDAVVASDGAVWFTDPDYGIMGDYEGKRSPSEQEGCFVYRISPERGEVEAKVRSMRKPNGLAFSPDEKFLYVADSAGSHDGSLPRHVMSFPVADNWTLGEGQPIAVVGQGVPDGLRVDERGNLWVSSARGVEVFAPDGTALGVIHIPEVVSNLTFGGPKNNRLFITGTTSIYSLFVAVSGAQRPK